MNVTPRSLVTIMNLGGPAPRAALAFTSGAPGGDVPGSAVVGSFPLRGGEPEWLAFKPNAVFLKRFVAYMRGELGSSPAILETGRFGPGEFAYAIDLRTPDPKGDVPFKDIIGWYRTDLAGRPIASSFEYNKDHVIVASESTFSSILDDPKVQAIALAP